MTKELKLSEAMKKVIEKIKDPKEWRKRFDRDSRDIERNEKRKDKK